MFLLGYVDSMIMQPQIKVRRSCQNGQAQQKYIAFTGNDMHTCVLNQKSWIAETNVFCLCISTTWRADKFLIKTDQSITQFPFEN